jgi:hypothetical protein
MGQQQVGFFLDRAHLAFSQASGRAALDLVRSDRIDQCGK